jgi:hypothetical protein
MQRVPAAARSVGEFWSERWNRPVSAWLTEYAFAPLVASGAAALALLPPSRSAPRSTPGCSTRDWAGARRCRRRVLPAAGADGDAGVEAARRALAGAAAHAWTLAWLLATSPLFVQPILQALGL